MIYIYKISCNLLALLDTLGLTTAEQVLRGTPIMKGFMVTVFLYALVMNVPCGQCTNAKVALAVHGGVCTLQGFDVKLEADKPNILSPTREYCDVHVVSKLYNKYIMQQAAGDVDVFVHSWMTDITSTMMDAFLPLCAKFEVYSSVFSHLQRVAANSRTVDIKWTARTLSMKRALHLVAEHEAIRGELYDFVILARPDVLLTRPIPIATLDRSKCYHDTGHSGTMDYFFMFNSTNAAKWANLFDTLPELSDFTSTPHHLRTNGLSIWRSFATSHLGQDMVELDLVPGVATNVFRKAYYGEVHPSMCADLHSFGFKPKVAGPCNIN